MRHRYFYVFQANSKKQPKKKQNIKQNSSILSHPDPEKAISDFANVTTIAAPNQPFVTGSPYKLYLIRR